MLDVIQNFISEKSEHTLEEYRSLLDVLFNTHQVLTAEECNILAKFFPKNADEQTEDSFVQVVRSVQDSRNQFNAILQNIPSEGLREELMQKFKTRS